MTAKAQQMKSDPSEKVKERKLKEVLNELKDYYSIDILFFDRYIDFNIPSDVVRWDKTIEQNLEEILKSTNLEYKKTKKGGFVISPKKLTQVELNESQLITQPQNPIVTTEGSNQTQIKSVVIPGAILVTGIVRDEAAQPLPGANVVEKGTTNGVVTDASGKYSITVQENATLVFSFIGYVSSEEAVASRSVIDISLKFDVQALSEVVVYGYGEMRRSDMTSAQSSISSKDISRTINTTLDQAIQGRAPGVYVTQNTGAPGGGVSVNIRGVNSINGSNEPLYVIDGVQIQGSTSITGTNALASLNPSDIESLEILQGPNATAIYGSRATNGVVLITTKRGKSGDMKITYNYSYSLQDRPKNLDVMNLQQYAQMYLNYKNATGDLAGIRDDFRDPSLLGKGTDWQTALFQQAAMQKQQISFSGGTDKSSYYLSGERMTQEGIGLGSGFNRTSVRLNVDNKPRTWLSIGTNVMVSQTDQKLGTMGTGTTNLWNNLILNAVQLGPDIPVRNIDGTYGAGNPAISTAQQYTPPNPVGLANLVTNQQTTRTLIGGTSVGIKVIKGLELRSNLNANIGYTNSTVFYPTYQFSTYQFNNTAVLQNQTNFNTYWLWNQMATYTNDFGKHHINAMVTHEAQASTYKNLMGQRQNFPTNNILDLNVGDPATAANGGGQGSWAMESYLGRINYNYDNRYIVTAAYRADGSVNFAPANKWGYFPSISAAYRISNEKFFDVPKINDLRLRFETGITGNQGNGGAIYGTLNAGPSQWGTSFSPGIYPNPNFKWEQTKTNNFGLTLGLFNGRIQLDADYYIKNTDNLILQSTLPWYLGTSGASAIQPPVVNIGSLQNKGWSFSVTTVNMNSGAFKWTSNFNISGFNTKIQSLTTGSGQIDRILGQPKGNEPFIERSVVGQAPWQFVGNIQQGVFQNLNDVINSPRPVDSNGNQQPVAVNSIWVGDGKYQDVSGDGKIDDKDLTFIGNPWPKWFGGFTNNFSYKGIELSVMITASYGNKIYNLTRDEETNPNNINLGRNMFTSVLNYANVQNDADGNPYLTNPNTVVPRIQSSKGLNNNFDRYTSTYVEDGSYARLKNVTLSYNLPASLIGKQKVIRGVRVAVSAQNLLTITNYKGYDPEVGAYVGNSYSGDAMVGVDYGRYPLTKVYSFSLGVEF
ncbi:SusC/RagA family TonB-linked outer membrane protein [Cytophagales bacterium WSM2-2]|nr:SusC/RagA family TonB-linked outer membrane protein [Cytophagales bacterium WSM2-2]